MDPSDAIQFFILFILLLLSAFFSSAETALTTVSKIKMRSLAEDGNKRAATVLDITEGGRDYEVKVNFDRAGIKKMFASFAKLKKVESL